MSYEATHTFQNGGSVSGPASIIAYAAQQELRYAADRKKWTGYLLQRGFAAAHPDDGWVDRENSTIVLVNPHFATTPIGEGDLIALGTPSVCRAVRVTKVIATPSFVRPGETRTRYEFVEVRAAFPLTLPR